MSGPICTYQMEALTDGGLWITGKLNAPIPVSQLPEVDFLALEKPDVHPVYAYRVRVTIQCK